MIKITHIAVTGPASLRLTFSDAQAGEVDLSGLIARPGVMVGPLRDSAYFARVFLEEGAPTWPTGSIWRPGPCTATWTRKVCSSLWGNWPERSFPGETGASRIVPANRRGQGLHGWGAAGGAF